MAHARHQAVIGMLSVHTDNRLMSGVSHSQELANVQRMMGLTTQQLLTSSAYAAQASFLAPEVRAQALARIQAAQRNAS
jgi:adenosine deaminase